ncbi:PREDICTED: COP9 signalosome complex subunit 6-like [Branchiostoma belcheri]|uniref:COP9 signalosome complex subunit 6 n=1 Tax=Branchiostoma belcheri TaxID=7741 RepID=A0A6P4Y0U8_BRABE|nr:PREDICTED: COP9 signalosome complex subunit 6-like [Branchiostoma belcheri]KAI8482297.1 COP9 signalosome complex subunit 6 [Branchiostoma belcheri]
MEVDEQGATGGAEEGTSRGVMAAPGTAGSVTVQLHPLVIMNVSEHWTRIRAQEGKAVQVLGALLGKQSGRNLEICNSFELMFDTIDGDIIIDRDYFSTKEEQFRQVFKELDFLGWYTTGGDPSEADRKVHRQVCEINESPILLKLNPMARHTDLPVSIYESVIDLVKGEATMLFVELQYTLATEEAERIGVDHVARMSNADTSDSSTVAEHLVAQHSAIKMLHCRVKIILEYIKDVQRGAVPRNHEIMREAYSLCHRLPVLDTPNFTGDFYNQCNDVSLMAYLGAITKGCNTINQFINKFSLLYDRPGMGRRMRGLFF